MIDTSVRALELEKATYFTWVNSSFVNWYIRYDETTLRPFFVRNYKHIDKEHFDLAFKKTDEPLLRHNSSKDTEEK